MMHASDPLPSRTRTSWSTPNSKPPSSGSSPDSKATSNSETPCISKPVEHLALPLPYDDDNGIFAYPAPPPSHASDDSSEDPDVFGSIDEHHPPLYADSPLDHGAQFARIAQCYLDNIEYTREIHRIQNLCYGMRHGPPRHLSHQDRSTYSDIVKDALQRVHDALYFDVQDVREIPDNRRDARLEMSQPRFTETLNFEPLPFEPGFLDLGDGFSIYDEPEHIDVIGRYFGSMDQTKAEGGQMLGGLDGPDLPDSTSIKPLFDDPIAEACRIRHMESIKTAEFRAHCEAVDALLEYREDDIIW